MVAKSGILNKRAAGAAPSTPPAAAPEKRFKGVRMRSWGKWVSEIRLPNTRARLWLGSFATAEQAARAFDVAVVCLRGRSATLNFPDSPPIYAPLGLAHHQIQELAAAAAAAAAAAPACTSSGISAKSESALSVQSDPATPAHRAVQCSSSLSAPCSPMSSAASPAACDSMSAVSIECEAATPAESCSSTWHDIDNLEGLLRLDGDSEPSPSPSLNFPLEYLQEEERWEELLWGPSLSSYSSWDLQLSMFPLQLPQEEDLPVMVEPCLWEL